MFTLPPIATASTALSVLPSVLAAPASDLVSTRVTPVALAAPLSNLALANDTPGAAAAPSSAPQAEGAGAQAGSVNSGLAGSLSASGPSSAFLAQLISQNEGEDEDNEDNQIALAASFAHFAPAPQYTTFMGYSIVKYRPSDAGLPSAYAPSAYASQNDDRAVTPSIASGSYGVTQSRNQSNLVSPEPQFAVAG